MSFKAGTRLGPYEIVAQLGAGGMGEVYRAHDPRLGRDVALKVLPEDVSRSPESLARFTREARAVAALNHPHIVTIHSTEEAEGVRFITMELIEGRTLDRIIPQTGVSLAQFFDVSIALADALDAAHRKQITHRDLKPANVMITDSGHVKVLDFGLARAAEPDGEASDVDDGSTRRQLTQVGTIVGTVPYMSPEQIEGRLVDGRSDIFSLGVMMYELAVGSRPFGGDSRPGLMSSILRDHPRPIAAVRPDLPRDVAALVHRCLEKQARDRVQTAHELLVELRAQRRAWESGASGRAASAATSSARTPSASGESRSSAASRELSLVVLPFANLSPDPANEYFSDGLTEEITADLSKVRALRVISRTSAMQLKGRSQSLREIAQSLGVRYVLEGSVRRAGASLRITAKLIDASTDAHVWSDKYSGTMEDVFEVQERVSREIVRALDLTLTSDESQRLAERPIANVRAYELYLQARQEIRRWGASTIDRAGPLLAQAVALEGDTPPLRALRAIFQVAQIRAGVNQDPLLLDTVEAQARQLLAGNPDMPEAHVLLGSIAYERGELPEAVWHCSRALDVSPDEPDAHLFLAASYMACGQGGLAVEAGRRAVAGDPLAANSWMIRGAASWFVGRFEEGLTDIRRGLELDPQNFLLRWTAGYTCTAMGLLDEARRHAGHLLEGGPDVAYTRQLLALIDALAGKGLDALERVKSVDLTPLDAHTTFHLAEPFAVAGDADRAFELLDLALDKGFYPYSFIAEHCPFLEPIRSLPRFEDIRAKARARTDAFERAASIRPA